MDAALNRGAEPEPGDDAEESILSGMHILVAEDNEINAEIFSELLNMAGAICDICENGQEVVGAFAASSPGEYRLILIAITCRGPAPQPGQNTLRCTVFSMTCLSSSKTTLPTQPAYNTGRKWEAGHPI